MAIQTETSELPSSSTLNLVYRFSPELREAYGEVPQTIAFLYALRDHSTWTLDHSYRTGFIVTELGLYVGYPVAVRRLLWRAATNHDLGKLAIDPIIIDNPRGLDPSSKLALRKHPRVGFDILVDDDELAAMVMIAHHEFQDDPYPRRGSRLDSDPVLKEYQMLLALSDGVDALRSRRPYKGSWSEGRTKLKLGKFFATDLINEALEAYAVVSP